MLLGVIIAILGLLLTVLGGFWYWKIREIAAGFAGSPMASSGDMTATLAISLLGFGLMLVLVGVTVCVRANADRRD